MSMQPTTIAAHSWRNLRCLRVLRALGLSAVLYSQLVPFSHWAVSALTIDDHSRAGEAVAFFL